MGVANFQVGRDSYPWRNPLAYDSDVPIKARLLERESSRQNLKQGQTMKDLKTSICTKCPKHHEHLTKTKVLLRSQILIPMFSNNPNSIYRSINPMISSQCSLHKSFSTNNLFNNPHQHAHQIPVAEPNKCHKPHHFHYSKRRWYSGSPIHF